MKFYKLTKKNKIVYLNTNKVPKDIFDHYNKCPQINEFWELPILKSDMYYSIVSKEINLIVLFKGYIFIKDIYGDYLKYIFELIGVIDKGKRIPIQSDYFNEIIYSKLKMSNIYDPETDKTLFCFDVDINPITLIISYKNNKELNLDLLRYTEDLTNIIRIK